MLSVMLVNIELEFLGIIWFGCFGLGLEGPGVMVGLFLGVSLSNKLNPDPSLRIGGFVGLGVAGTLPGKTPPVSIRARSSLFFMAQAEPEPVFFSPGQARATDNMP